MSRISICKSILGGLFILLPMIGKSQCEQSYNFPVQSAQAITVYFEGSVVRIRTGAGTVNTGTGFIIDSEQGYVITASHVIQATINDPDVEIVATSSSFPNQEFNMILVKELNEANEMGVDAALLKAKNPDTLSQLPEFELGFNRPTPGANAVGFGYPNIADGTLITRNFEFSSPKSNLLTSGYQFEEGYSGGPAIILEGLAVAIHKSSVPFEGFTYHTPSLLMVDLINYMTPNDKVTQLVKLVQDSGISLEQWEQYLRPKPSPLALSNIEVIQAARLIKSLDNKSPQFLAKVNCLKVALNDRGINHAANMDLAPYAAIPARESIPEFMELAQFYRDFNMIEDAKNAYMVSKAILADELNNAFSEDQELFISGACNTGLNYSYLEGEGIPIVSKDLTLSWKIEGNENTPCDALLNDSVADRYNSATLRDYALINQKISSLEIPIAEKETAITDGVGASMLAVSLAEDERTVGAALAILGDLYANANDSLIASQAYATAFQKGYALPWVQSNWSYHARNAQSDIVASSAPIDDYEEPVSITEAPGIRIRVLDNDVDNPLPDQRRTAELNNIVIENDEFMIRVIRGNL